MAGTSTQTQRTGFKLVGDGGNDITCVEMYLEEETGYYRLANLPCTILISNVLPKNFKVVYGGVEASITRWQYVMRTDGAYTETVYVDNEKINEFRGTASNQGVCVVHVKVKDTDYFFTNTARLFRDFRPADFPESNIPGLYVPSENDINYIKEHPPVYDPPSDNMIKRTDLLLRVFTPVPYTYVTDDPYKPGGNSGGGGGGGSFDGTNDKIPVPDLPMIQLTHTGFLSLYNPTPTQLLALADFLWSDVFSVDSFKKIFSDPMDAILGLQLVPVIVARGTPKEVIIGNVSTGVEMPPVITQWVNFSCGSLTVPEYWGSYLDYNPYTKIQLVLPFVGTFDISADDVIGKTLTVEYNIDVLSGACTAFLVVDDGVLYSWQGSVGLQIPFSGNSYNGLLNGILQVAGAGVSIATAGTAGAVASASLSAVSGVANAMKENISHGGSIAGAGGFLNVKTPYIVLTVPNLCKPADQPAFLGYPSFVTSKLNALKGMTQIEEIHIENVPATANELEEIESLLKSGVIF